MDYDPDDLNERTDWLLTWLIPGQPPRLSRRRMFIEECRARMELARQGPGGTWSGAYKAWEEAAIVANDIFSMPPGTVDIPL